VTVLKRLSNSLKKGKWFIELNRHRYFGQVLSHAALENGPDAQVILRCLGWQLRSNDNSSTYMYVHTLHMNTFVEQTLSVYF